VRWHVTVSLGFLVALLAACATKPQPSQPETLEVAERFARQATSVQAAEDWSAAAAAWERSARHFQLLNQLTNLSVAWHNEGVARRELGQLDKSRQLLEKAAKLNDALGQTNAWWRNQIALLQLEQMTAPQSAAQRLTLIQGARLSPTDPELVALLAHEEGRLAVARGDLDRAATALARAESTFASIHNLRGQAAVHVTLARLLREKGDLDGSERAWRAALEQYEQLAYPRGITVAMAGLGSCLAARGDDLAEAASLLERAVENFRSLGLEREAVAAAAELDSVTGRINNRANPPAPASR
jgi:tetratricopeptide (TPR) repeat protein